MGPFRPRLSSQGRSQNERNPHRGAGFLVPRARVELADTVIFSHVLYQLSYLGVSGGGRRDSNPRSPA